MLLMTPQVKDHMTYVRPQSCLPFPDPRLPCAYPHPNAFTNIYRGRSTKLFLYTTLNQKVTDHRSVLSKRTKVLEDVQKGLLKDGKVLI